MATPTAPRDPHLDVVLPHLMAALRKRQAAERRRRLASRLRLRFRPLLHPLRAAYPVLHPRRCKAARLAEMRHQLFDLDADSAFPVPPVMRPEVAS